MDRNGGQSRTHTPTPVVMRVPARAAHAIARERRVPQTTSIWTTGNASAIIAAPPRVMYSTGCSTLSFSSVLTWWGTGGGGGNTAWLPLLQVVLPHYRLCHLERGIRRGGWELCKFSRLNTTRTLERNRYCKVWTKRHYGYTRIRGWWKVLRWMTREHLKPIKDSEVFSYPIMYCQTFGKFDMHVVWQALRIGIQVVGINSHVDRW